MMASNYSAIKVHNKLPIFFKKLQEISVPPKVQIKWLETIGYKSTNHRPFVRLLHNLGFVEKNGAPNQRFRDYRDESKCKKIMGEALRDAYSVLYQIYPDAHNRDLEEIKNIFKSKTTVDEETTMLMAQTFQTLVSLADFENGDEEEGPSAPEAPPSLKPSDIPKKLSPPITVQPLSLAINIQLVLPETDNPDIYDNLFAALRKNIITPGKEDE